MHGLLFLLVFLPSIDDRMSLCKSAHQLVQILILLCCRLEKTFSPYINDFVLYTKYTQRSEFKYITIKRTKIFFD